MARPNRVVSVTVRLIGLGAVAGAVCGAVIPLVVVLLTGPGNLSVLGRAVALSAGFGAVVGSVAGPAVAWDDAPCPLCGSRSADVMQLLRCAPRKTRRSRLR